MTYPEGAHFGLALPVLSIPNAGFVGIGYSIPFVFPAPSEIQIVRGVMVMIVVYSSPL